MVRRDVVGVIYSTQDSDSSRRQGILSTSYYPLPFFFLKFLTFYEFSSHKAIPFFSETRDQFSARVLSATDDETQSQTVNPIQQLTHAASEMDKPNDMHVSSNTSQNRVRFLYECCQTYPFRSIRTPPGGEYAITDIEFHWSFLIFRLQT